MSPQNTVPLVVWNICLTRPEPCEGFISFPDLHEHDFYCFSKHYVRPFIKGVQNEMKYKFGFKVAFTVKFPKLGIVSRRRWIRSRSLSPGVSRGTGVFRGGGRKPEDLDETHNEDVKVRHTQAASWGNRNEHWFYVWNFFLNPASQGMNTFARRCMCFHLFPKTSRYYSEPSRSLSSLWLQWI